MILGAVAALAVAVCIAAFTKESELLIRTATPAPPSDFQSLPPITVPQIVLALDGHAAADAGTVITSPPLPAQAPAKPRPQKNVPPSAGVAPIAAALPSAPQVRAVTQAELDASAATLRAALVNIVCDAASSQVRSISGSGVIVDAKGIILTNAHIGQYFLLRDYPSADSTKCVIRTGSPAQTAYEAKLIFISPAWIAANPKTLVTSEPTGTGEHDIALLAITKSDTAAALPSAFPFVQLAESAPEMGAPIVIGSYAAQFLSVSQIQSALYPTLVFDSVKEVLTFAANTVDILSLGGTPAAQEGSSGGGVADANGNLVGTITTSTVTGETATRNLRAISAGYVRRDYLAETGTLISDLFAAPTSDSIASFATQIPGLAAAVEKQFQ